ncbi:N-6 DNA methylase [Pontiellaceae bacterium B12227]|nr:N-6 DNA methylase [Pontiellaceae bacterium B12227]
MKKVSNNTFTTVTTQGGMFPPEFLQRICDLDKEVKGLGAVDYHLPEHRRVSEEANRAWSVLLADWKAFKFKVDGLGEADPSTGITRDQWLLPLFQQLGYGRLKKAGATEIEGKDYPVSHFWEQSPIHLVGWNYNLDTRSAGAAGAARFAPHGMLQEFLNRSDEHLWGFVSNGRQLRILRDNISMTRQAYVEFDLVAMMEGECFSDFVLLWLLCHNSRVEVPLDEEGNPRTPEACWLEQWSREAETQGARMLDHLREGVEEAIQTFGSGFLAHPANQELRERLRAGELDKQDYYRQLLRLVYRLIFLFVAEDRDLLHEAGADAKKKKLYFDHYSTQRIRRIAEVKRGSQHRDLWESFKLLFSWLSDEDGCDRLGLAPLGGFLFSDDAMPDLAASKVANVDLLNAVRCLAVTDGDGARRPVDYRNLGAEELGSIYESLLEMHPNLHLEAATFELDVAAGNERKSTGSYYTPKSLVNCLLDSALDPVVQDRLKSAAKQSAIENRQSAMEQALLDLKVCDPACGSGHFLIGAAHRIAKHLASVRSGDAEPSPEATHHALRDVITHCIYGVDINPMSVELCKVSLWMEAMEPGKPLGFLDHHIKCGNSLLGTTPALLNKGIPDAAFKAIEGDDKTICAALKKRNKEERKAGFQDLFGNMEAEWSYQHAFEDAVHELEDIDDDSIQSLEKKQVAYEEFLESTSYVGGKRLHDAWCAVFVCEKTKDSPVITQQLISEMQKDPNRCPEAQRELIDDLSGQYNFFHWHIEFPEVFQSLVSFTDNDFRGWSGGFDCILGNPPWEKTNLNAREWFSASRPDIANARTAAVRAKLIKELEVADNVLYCAYKCDQRIANGIGQFLKISGQFALSARGDTNTYAVFADLDAQLLNSKGRTGFIVPSGIAFDETTKLYFQNLVEKGLLLQLIDFDNGEGIFPEVHRSYRFSLLTILGRSRDMSSSIGMQFFVKDVAEIRSSEHWITISPEDIELINPNTKTCPIFRTSRDAELTKGIYRRVPVLVRDAGALSNFWDVQIYRMLHSSADSVYFQPEGEGLSPIHEAKCFHQFNHRFSTYKGDSYTHPQFNEMVNCGWESSPAHYIDLSELPEVLRKKVRPWYVAYRCIGRATDERTIISSLLPTGGVINSANIIEGLDSKEASLLTGMLNSFIVDYIARQSVGGANIQKFVVQQLPVLTFDQLTREDMPAFVGSVTEWVATRVFELVYTSGSLDEFAAGFGYSRLPFIWNEDRRFEIRCELDAAFFLLYGIDIIADVDYIMETFPIVKRKDIAKYGTYRTKERILEIYQEMARCTAKGREYQSTLNPPPGPPADADGNFIPMSEWDPNNWPSHIHRPKEEGVKKKIKHGERLYAFSHGAVTTEDGVSVTLEVVTQSDAEQIPVEGEERLFELAKVSTYIATISSDIESDAFLTLLDVEGGEAWFEMAVEPSSDPNTFLYVADTDENILNGVARLEKMPPDAQTIQEKRFELPPVSNEGKIQGELDKIASADETFVAVYDVGQGLCSAICEASSSAPLVYFDMGCGHGRNNAHTRRGRKLRFCHSQNPPIILSHWHTDHYRGATVMDKRKDALKAMWIAPWQKVGADAAKFAAKLYSPDPAKNKIHIWPTSLGSAALPWGVVKQCTGTTKNTSGLALDVEVGDGTHSVLMPGDAGYNNIPGAKPAYDSLVVSHHAGHTSGAVNSSGKSGGTFAIPLGANNSHGHPLQPTIKKLTADGWSRRLDTDGGHIALGYPHPGLPTLGCGGNDCDLGIKQA